MWKHGPAAVEGMQRALAWEWTPRGCDPTARWNASAFAALLATPPLFAGGDSLTRIVGAGVRAVGSSGIAQRRGRRLMIVGDSTSLGFYQTLAVMLDTVIDYGARLLAAVLDDPRKT